MVALRFADFGYILENGRVVMEGSADAPRGERGREGVLPRHLVAARGAASARPSTTGAASVGWLEWPRHYDALETRDPGAARARPARAPAGADRAREAEVAVLRARCSPDVDAAAVDEPRRARAACRSRASPTLIEQQNARSRRSAGSTPRRSAALARIFMSPGPIYDPEGRGADYWRTARTLFAAGFRAGDLVHQLLLVPPVARRRACSRPGCTSSAAR